MNKREYKEFTDEELNKCWNIITKFYDKDFSDDDRKILYAQACRKFYDMGKDERDGRYY